MTHSIIRFLTVAFLLSGCSNLPAPSQMLNTPTPGTILESQSIVTVTPGTEQSQKDFMGLVVDMDGKMIPGAEIESSGNTATSDNDGRFQFPSAGFPQWIKVTSSGFISRTRAASPGAPIIFRLTPDDGKTIVIHFAGDTMFGRRF